MFCLQPGQGLGSSASKLIAFGLYFYIFPDTGDGITFGRIVIKQELDAIVIKQELDAIVIKNKTGL